jgi:hydrogenase nickel incorporation protein HypA/HybF
MHEYSIAQSLLTRVDASLAGHHVVAIRRLSVRIGELSGVDAGLLRTAYELCRTGTPCDGAELDIADVPARWTCKACEQSARQGGRLICPACGGPMTLAEGDEIVLDRIEAEVEDV